MKEGTGEEDREVGGGEGKEEWEERGGKEREWLPPLEWRSGFAPDVNSRLFQVSRHIYLLSIVQ